MKKLTRRRVLRGAVSGAAVTLALPLLDIFLNSNGDALADGSAFPRRFALFFWGNGMLPDKWTPTGTGAGDAWQLSEQLSPLANVKDKITVVSGTKVQTPNPIAHHSGAAGILSGTPLIVSGESGTFGGPSIDQIIAAETGKETRFKSLESSITTTSGTWSYNGPNQNNPGERSPKAMYDRVFGEGFFEPGETPIIDPKVGLRRSVLDGVLEDSKRLESSLGAADKARLDQHMNGIRELEQRLKKLEDDPPMLASCKRPDEPKADYPAVDGRLPLSEISRAHIDVITMALACDQTRVASHFFTHSVANALFPEIPTGHHRLTHDEPGDQPQVNKIVQLIMAEYAYMVESFAKIPEGDGTLLDNMVALATSDCSYGRQHLLEEYPLVLAGSCCGALKQGIHYRSETFENSSKVMLSIARAMKLNLASFGAEAGYTTDGLGAIEA